MAVLIAVVIVLIWIAGIAGGYQEGRRAAERDYKSELKQVHSLYMKQIDMLVGLSSGPGCH